VTVTAAAATAATMRVRMPATLRHAAIRGTRSA
jgi:hypothetical protein